MQIKAAQISVWPDFVLNIPQVLDFQAGLSYHLQGANGSGKSSFVSQLLLPQLLNDCSCYKLYFEQQMNLQLHAVKAYASIFKPHQALAGERDVTRYLLEELRAAQELETRPCYVLVDESRFEQLIQDFLRQYIPSACLIFSSHNNPFPNARKICFELENPGRSKVYASAD